jgi:hypothetical protein
LYQVYLVVNLTTIHITCGNWKRRNLREHITFGGERAEMPGMKGNGAMQGSCVIAGTGDWTNTLLCDMHRVHFLMVMIGMTNESMP